MAGVADNVRIADRSRSSRYDAVLCLLYSASASRPRLKLSPVKNRQGLCRSSLWRIVFVRGFHEARVPFSKVTHRRDEEKLPGP